MYQWVLDFFLFWQQFSICFVLPSVPSVFPPVFHSSVSSMDSISFSLRLATAIFFLPSYTCVYSSVVAIDYAPYTLESFGCHNSPGLAVIFCGEYLSNPFLSVPNNQRTMEPAFADPMVLVHFMQLLPWCSTEDPPGFRRSHE